MEWNNPSIKYEVRTISSAPPLSQCGYATPFYNLMKIPVSGEVRYWVNKKNVSENKLRRRLSNQGVSQENIDSEIKALASFERVSFKNRGDSWALCSFGGMKFAPFRHMKNGHVVYIGQLTEDNGSYAAQDKLVQPQEGVDNAMSAIERTTDSSRNRAMSEISELGTTIRSSRRQAEASLGESRYPVR